jgi:hypothetical protein
MEEVIRFTALQTVNTEGKWRILDDHPGAMGAEQLTKAR